MTAGAIANPSAENLRRSLLLTAELLRLLDVLPPALAFKGPVLAQRLYGDVSAREYCDLDLLLRPADIPTAIAALERLGYTAALPLAPWQLHVQLRSGCEYAMSDGRAHLELHWQFAPRQFGARFDVGRLFARSTTVRIGDRDVPALSPEDAFLMLAVHGAKHGWNKMSWISDLAALLRASPLDWDYVRAEARRMRILRLLRLACALAGSGGAPLPDDFRSDLERDARISALADQVRRNFEAGRNLDQDDRARHRFILALQDSAPGRLAYLLRYALTPTLDDWNYVRLPRGFRGLYPAVRLVRLATRSSP